MCKNCVNSLLIYSKDERVGLIIYRRTVNTVRKTSQICNDVVCLCNAVVFIVVV